MIVTLLSACASQPVASRAPECAAYVPIDAIATHDEIFLIFIANEHTMRPLTDQINTINKTRASRCS